MDIWLKSILIALPVGLRIEWILHWMFLSIGCTDLTLFYQRLLCSYCRPLRSETGYLQLLRKIVS